MLTLYITPVYYVYIEKARGFFASRKARRQDERGADLAADEPAMAMQSAEQSAP